MFDKTFGELFLPWREYFSVRNGVGYGSGGHFVGSAGRRVSLAIRASVAVEGEGLLWPAVSRACDPDRVGTGLMAATPGAAPVLLLLLLPGSSPSEQLTGSPTSHGEISDLLP